MRKHFTMKEIALFMYCISYQKLRWSELDSYINTTQISNPSLSK